MAQKGAPTVAGTSQNWAQNASQSTQNPLQKCTGQPYIHTGNAKIADFIAVENQMKIWIIKSHVFHFPVCVSGSNGRPRRPKNAENLFKNSNFFFKNRVGSTARLSGRVVGQSYARLKAEIELHNIRTTTEHDSQPPTVHFWFLCPVATTSAPSRSRTPPSPPRNRNANQYKSTEKYRKRTEIQVCHREVRVELNGGAHRIRDGKISRFPLLQHLPRCPSAGATFPSAGTENAIPKSSATSSGVPLRLPLSKIRVAHGRPNFCFQSLYEMSTQWWPF